MYRQHSSPTDLPHSAALMTGVLLMLAGVAMGATVILMPAALVTVALGLLSFMYGVDQPQGTLFEQARRRRLRRRSGEGEPAEEKEWTPSTRLP